MSRPFQIARCTAFQRPDALRVLHAGLSVDQQLALVQSLQATRDQGEDAFEGLFVATGANEIVGAAWAQLAPGQTAVVWLPDPTSAAATELMQTLADFLDEREIALAQLLVSENDTVAPELIAAGDFQRLAKLAYLAVDRELFPTGCPQSKLDFEPRAGEQPERLGKLLLSTYEASLDCPRLNGVRRSDDTLDGYREQGIYTPELWFFVRRQQQDIGTLLLTTHVDSGNWELVYMGLVPEARGAGLGRDVLQFAMWQAREGGAERLVLAVDQANRPALTAYEQAGFVAWDHRTVYARLRPQE